MQKDAKLQHEKEEKVNLISEKVGIFLLCPNSPDPDPSCAPPGGVVHEGAGAEEGAGGGQERPAELWGESR